MRTAGRAQDASIATGGGREIAGVGRISFWNGGSLWIGRNGGRARLHAHHAIQITVALDSVFLLRGETNAGWTEFTGAIVTPHCRHQFDGCGASIAHVFIEPETAPGRALLARFGSDTLAALPSGPAVAIAAELRERYRAGVSDERLAAAARHAVSLLTGADAPHLPVDPRITRAIDHVRSKLASRVSLADAAAAAHLSPSRFRHLFVAQTGAAFRAYVLWLRINAAVRMAMQGRSWTVAAHEAGFADSAHLSRTFRRMFGVVPAMLVRE